MLKHATAISDLTYFTLSDVLNRVCQKYPDEVVSYLKVLWWVIDDDSTRSPARDLESRERAILGANSVAATVETEDLGG